MTRQRIFGNLSSPAAIEMSSREHVSFDSYGEDDFDDDQDDDSVVVHRRLQPIGEPGVRYSLEQTGEFASEGRFQPRVLSWATHQLKEHGFPKTDLGKAKAIHEGILRDLNWVPDAIDAEVIRAPKFMLPDPVTGRKAKFVAGDCDDITATELACLMAVGLRTAALGHSYEDDEQIGHVLGEVWDSQNKRWWFVDGSARKLKFGEAFEPTRSRRIELPTKIMTCDTSGQCPIGQAPEIPDDVDHDLQFVGLAGVPGEDFQATTKSTVGEVVNHVFDPALAGDAGFDEGFDVYLAQATARAQRAWASLLRLHDGVRASLKAQGLAVSSEAFKPYWAPELQDRLVDAGIKGEVLISAAEDALAGKRALQVVGPENARDLGMELLPADEVLVAEDSDGALHLLNRDRTPHKHVSAPSGALAGVKWQQADGESIGTLLALKSLTDYFEEMRLYLDLKTQEFFHDRYRATENPLERRKVLEAEQIFRSAEAWSESAPEAPKQSYGKAVSESFTTAMWALGGVAALVAVANWSDKRHVL